ncbi:MAG: hypothetical protein FWC95_00015 [Defluviitaleaceae bacterium]|nr:hypothetical protein [Defluviitaleaceae bacterium]
MKKVIKSLMLVVFSLILIVGISVPLAADPLDPPLTPCPICNPDGRSIIECEYC